MNSLIEVRPVQKVSEQETDSVGKRDGTGTKNQNNTKQDENLSKDNLNGNGHDWLKEAHVEGMTSSQTTAMAAHSVTSDFAERKGFETPVEVIINEEAVAEIDKVESESGREPQGIVGMQGEFTLKVDPETGLGNIYAAQRKLAEAPMLSVWGRMIDVRDRMWAIAKRLFEKLPTFPKSQGGATNPVDATSSTAEDAPIAAGPSNETVVEETV